MLYKIIFFLIIPLFGAKLEISGVRDTHFVNGKFDYTINSKEYINNFSKIDLKFLLSKEKYMLENDFYKDGFIEFADAKIYFKKAYKLGGKVNILDANGYIKNAKISAKKVIYYKNRLILYKCEIKTVKKILRRRKYIFYISNSFK